MGSTKLNEILGFMNPFSDLLSTIFIVSMVMASIGTVIWLSLSANTTQWEKNWHGENLDSINQNLDDEHGSITDLSDAVATKSEKIADIIPSMLLVFGLLGTFLGLGMALNHASNVLANISTTGMDSAMSQLLGMMDGLGAKFKTSTWGILCFITLNIIFNIKGATEKRLAWVIQKVRQEAELKKVEYETKENQKHSDLINAMNHIALTTKETHITLVKNIVTLFQNHQSTTQQNFQMHQDSQHVLFNTMAKTLVENHKDAKQQASDNQTAQQSLLNTLTKTLVENHKDAKQQASDSQTAQQSLLNAMTKTLVENHKDAKQQANDSQAAQQLLLNAMTKTLVENHKDAKQQASENQNSQKSLLNTITQTLLSNHKDTIEQTQNNLTILEKNSTNSLSELRKIANSNQATQESMQEFVSTIGESMSSIGDSATNMAGAAKGMADAAGAVGLSADKLNGVVDHLQSELKEVMGTIKDDLGSTIINMGDSFEKNMGDMSTAMSTATNGISTSVSALSDSVDKTLVEVTKVIGESMSLQRKSAGEFEVTSTILNSQIGEMTNLVKKLSGDITSGLSAISANNRRINAISSNFEQITKNNTQLAQENQELLENMKSFTNSNNQLFEDLTQNLNVVNQTSQQLAEGNQKILEQFKDLTDASSQFKNKVSDGLEQATQQQLNIYEALKSNSENNNHLKQNLNNLQQDQQRNTQAFASLNESLSKLTHIAEKTQQLINLTKESASLES